MIHNNVWTNNISSQSWLISGQSNAVGSAVGIPTAPIASVTMYNGLQWVPAQDPLPAFDHTGTEGTIGAWVTAGQAYVFWEPTRTVRLHGWAQPSLDISVWDVGGAGRIGLTSAVQLLTDVTAFIWFQGESDAVAGTLCSEYYRILVNLINYIRSITTNRLPVIIIGLATAPSGIEAGYWTIRETQKTVAKETNALYITAEGLPLGTLFHLSAAGYSALGKQIGAMLARRV